MTRKIVVLMLFLVVSFSWMLFTYAQEELDFSIIPKSEWLDGNEIKNIAEWGSVRDNYNREAENIGTDETRTADQIQSGIMNRDTILNYIVYLARFIWELGLLIAALVLIYMGYDRAAKVFSFSDSKISMVIKWLIVVIGAYFIVMLVYNAFIS